MHGPRRFTQAVIKDVAPCGFLDRLGLLVDSVIGDMVRELFIGEFSKIDFPAELLAAEPSPIIGLTPAATCTVFPTGPPT